ncbi:hypothetical protein DMH12_03055 [Streptomyces sp. WAC 04229]|nr:hypothetical protein DMH12_03055 [Streptomyces sp. WAC 04229]
MKDHAKEQKAAAKRGSRAYKAALAEKDGVSPSWTPRAAACSFGCTASGSCLITTGRARLTCRPGSLVHGPGAGRRRRRSR